MWRFLRNRRLILRLHYYLGTHILGASRGGPCDSTALVTFTIQAVKTRNSAFERFYVWGPDLPGLTLVKQKLKVIIVLIPTMVSDIIVQLCVVGHGDNIQCVTGTVEGWCYI